MQSTYSRPHCAHAATLCTCQSKCLGLCFSQGASPSQLWPTNDQVNINCLPICCERITIGNAHGGETSPLAFLALPSFLPASAALLAAPSEDGFTATGTPPSTASAAASAASALASTGSSAAGLAAVVTASASAAGVSASSSTDANYDIVMCADESSPTRMCRPATHVTPGVRAVARATHSLLLPPAAVPTSRTTEAAGPKISSLLTRPC